MNNKTVWTVATGNVNPWLKASREAVQYIGSLEGFVAAHPHYPDGVLWLFDSKRNAIAARNLMEAKGIQCGRNICKGCIEGETLIVEDAE